MNSVVTQSICFLHHIKQKSAWKQILFRNLVPNFTTVFCISISYDSFPVFCLHVSISFWVWESVPHYQFSILAAVMPMFLSVFSYMYADNEPTVWSWTTPHSHTVYLTERLIMATVWLVQPQPKPLWSACPMATGVVCPSKWKKDIRLDLEGGTSRIHLKGKIAELQLWTLTSLFRLDINPISITFCLLTFS